jgi:hypothetical protein
VGFAEVGVGGLGCLGEVLEVEGAGARAVAGVVVDEGGDFVLGKEGLGLMPVVEAVAYAVEEEDGGLGWGGGDGEAALEGALWGGNLELGVGWVGLWGGLDRVVAELDEALGDHDGDAQAEVGEGGHGWVYGTGFR